MELVRNRTTYFLVALLLLSMFLFSIFSMKGDSATTDELAHIPSGYSLLKKGDFRLNPEHPPLAKVLSAIPLLFLNLKQPFDHQSWQKIDQWENGEYFLYQAKNDPDQILFWSRLPMVFLLLILGFFIFKWVKKLYGNKLGLFVLFLFCFSPNFIAHGRLVTTDVAAALGFVLAIYYFNQYLKKPLLKNLALAGIMFGIAQLFKYSALLLIPIFLIYIVFKTYLDKPERFWKALWSYGKGLLTIFLIGFILVWLVYIPVTFNTPLEIENQLIDQSFPGPGASSLNQFLKTLAPIPILKALGHYLHGLFMVFLHTFGGHTTFLLGDFSRTGWWYYFPLTFLFKTPLTLIILLTYSLVLLITKKVKDKFDLWNTVLFLTPFLIYWIVSMKGSLNLGVRHLLLTFPFIYLLIARSLYPLFNQRNLWPKIAIFFLSIWYLIGSVSIYPHYIAYFNEIGYLAKKPKHEILLDSSLDWGQDLKRLAKFVKENNIEKIKVDYFGGGSPKFYIPESLEWHSEYGPTSGWLAVSASNLKMSEFHGQEEGQPDYSYLKQYQPKATIGDSILVYYIEEE